MVSETGHRPWPLPDTRWVMAQTWDDLLFAHWRVDYDAVRQHIPSGLELERHDGSAWVGVTPFVITGFRLRGTPALPVFSTFPEINVRTYVNAGGGEKPGIWFFSLDTSSQIAVEGARRTYRLPYHHAQMRVEQRGERIEYSSSRRGAARPHVFRGTYGPVGAPAPAAPGSLEYFLTERYCLYAEHEGRLCRADIHHPPWPLQTGEATIELNTMAPDGIDLDGEALCHFSRRQDVVIWSPDSV